MNKKWSKDVSICSSFLIQRLGLRLREEATVLCFTDRALLQKQICRREIKKKKKCNYMHGYTYSNLFLIQRRSLCLRGEVTVYMSFLCFTDLAFCFRDRYVMDNRNVIICMVWQAENFLIKRLNLCLRGKATIQIGVFVLQINKALLQRRMYYKKVVRMSFHARLCRR